MTCLLLGCGALRAEESTLFEPQWLGAQYTFIDQHQDSLHSPYAGPLSLRANGDTERSHTFGAYFGMALPVHLQLYADVEMFKGEGVSGATGMGGLTNGDVIRSGSAGLPKTPYLARAFLRWSLPLGEETQDVERGQDQLPGKEATERFEVKLGKMSVADDFDKNRYADSTRTQFMNWSLFNNTAWDFAADTRGYTNGLVLALVQKSWSLRYGIYMMPYEANGQRLDAALAQSQGQQIELTLQPHEDGWALRFLAFYNTARMGIYRDALAIAQATGQLPDIKADDANGRHKHGFAINGELPLADNGDTGLFLRAGWNDGRTESFVFTEVDRTLSTGFQLSGVHWSRPNDHFAVAIVIDGLSSDHRDYLAAGGDGFVLGDGRLNYGHEEILEAYYNVDVIDHLTLSPDLQLVHNPGYNRDRGPARFVGLRAHVEF